MDEVEKERFPDSKSSREKPFKMYKENKVITVRLIDVEEGWNFDKTGDTQVNCNFHSKSCSSQTQRWQVPSFLEF